MQAFWQALIKSERRRDFFRLMVGIVLAQLAYWAVLQPLVFDRPTLPPRLEITEVLAAPLDGAHFASIDPQAWEIVDLPWSSCCAPGYRGMQLRFTLDEVTPDGLGLIAYINADNAHVYLNGSAVLAEGRLEQEAVSHRRLRDLIHLPSGLLVEGENTLTYVMVRAGPPYFDVNRAPIIAPYNELAPAARKRLFIINDYALVSASIGGVVALLALVVAVRSQSPQLPFWMFVISAAWTLRILHTLWPEPLVDPLFHSALVFVWLNLIALGWVNFANEWTGKPWRWMRISSLAIGGLSLLACFVLARFVPHPTGFDIASDLVNLVGLIFVTGAVARLVVHVSVSGEARILEASVFALIVSLLGLEALSELRFDLPAGHLHTTLPLLLVALISAFAARNLRLFRSLHDLNAQLNTTLSKRERELRDSLERERKSLQLAAETEERRRIMRDMHDGLGGQLLALASAAKAGRVSTDRLSAGFDYLIRELRAILDSLDGGDEPIGFALAGLRLRLQEQAELAEVELEWKIGTQASELRLGPRKLLELTRVIEEAFTNALRHSRSDVVCVHLDRVDASLRLEVSDQGQGMPIQPLPHAGRGLENMRVRAERLGADLLLEPGEPGLRVTLEIPEVFEI